MLRYRLVLFVVLSFLLGTASGIVLRWHGIVDKVTRALNKPAGPQASKVRPPILGKGTFVVLVAGQSNAGNFGEIRTRASDASFAFAGNEFFDCADPLPGAGGTGGSPWPLLAQLIIDEQFVSHVIVANVAQGSTSVNDWQAGDKAFDRLLTTAQRLESRGYPIDVVIWYQGESDALAHMNSEEYRTSLMHTINSFRSSQFNAPWVICLCSRYGDLPAWLPVRIAQQTIAENEWRTCRGVDTDLIGPEYRHDGVHLNLAGQERFAQEISQILKEQFFHKYDEITR